MGGVFAAYMVTTGLIVYRWGSQAKQAPPPMAFAGEALIFGVVALIAERDARLGTTMAWAFTIGALLAPNLTQTAGPLSAGPGAPAGSSGGSASGGSGSQFQVVPIHPQAG